LEEEIKGLLWGEILGQEVMYTQFDSEHVERLLQLGKHLSMIMLLTSRSQAYIVDDVVLGH